MHYRKTSKINGNINGKKEKELFSNKYKEKATTTRIQKQQQEEQQTLNKEQTLNKKYKMLNKHILFKLLFILQLQATIILNIFYDPQACQLHKT